MLHNIALYNFVHVWYEANIVSESPICFIQQYNFLLPFLFFSSLLFHNNIIPCPQLSETVRADMGHITGQEFAIPNQMV